MLSGSQFHNLMIYLAFVLHLSGNKYGDKGRVGRKIKTSKNDKNVTIFGYKFCDVFSGMLQLYTLNN